MTDGQSCETGGGLAPTSAASIDDYFARFRVEALTAGAKGWEDAVADLREYVRDGLAETAGTSQDAARVLSEIGPPKDLAAAYAEGPHTEEGPPRLSGRFPGVPYDMRTPGSQRFASRWDPVDRRILVPKALGVGWTVNLGALAVLTDLVDTHDEDVPFGAVPPRIVAATLVFPLVASVAFAALAAEIWSHLPARVLTHWSLSGESDGYGSRVSTLLFLSVMTAVPVALAVGVHLRRRPPLNPAGASALSLALTTLALAVLVQTLFTLGGGVGLWPMWLGVVCSLGLSFVLLAGVSRIGRAAEQRRDLFGASTKGCA
jgi:hypothetical protein